MFQIAHKFYVQPYNVIIIMFNELVFTTVSHCTLW